MVTDESVEGPTVAALRAAGHMVFRNREPHCGVLLIRSTEDDPGENAANTLAAIQQHGPELLNRFSVLVGRAPRIRIAPYQAFWEVLNQRLRPRLQRQAKNQITKQHREKRKWERRLRLNRELRVQLLIDFRWHVDVFPLVKLRVIPAECLLVFALRRDLPRYRVRQRAFRGNHHQKLPALFVQ